MKRMFFIFIIMLCLVGCSNNDNSNNDENISYMEAKEMIINDNAILVDVRTQEEYDAGHIDGAYLLPVNSIDEDTAGEVISSKDSIVIVYCRSGARSSEAADKLKNLGYTNIYDLGSINNWEE